ncbi:hypothetical protein D3C75_1184720 [compost metagenome]
MKRFDLLLQRLIVAGGLLQLLKLLIAVSDILLGLLLSLSRIIVLRLRNKMLRQLFAHVTHNSINLGIIQSGFLQQFFEPIHLYQPP